MMELNLIFCVIEHAGMVYISDNKLFFWTIQTANVINIYI